MTEALAKYPKELTDGRDYIEMTFVMALWKEPDLYGDYGNEINVQKDLFLMDSMFYFKLGKEMYDLGARSFDDITIASHVSKSEVYLEGINRRGGIREIDKMRAIINTDNIEAYYDKLIKTNILMRLHDKGFDVLKDIKKFDKMTSSQVYDYFEYQLDNTFLSRGSGIKVEDLSISDQFLNDCNDGLELGLSYGKKAKLLNYHTLGIHRANVQIFAGYSGTGKCQNLDSLIMTPTGYVRMGDIKLGDEIFGDDGKIYNVNGVFPQGLKDMYEVKFSDGSSTITCNEHLWNVQDNNLRRVGKFKTVTLDEIMSKSLYRESNGYKQWSHYIPMIKPLEFKECEELPIDSYVLGLLIGDGTLNSKSIKITIHKEEKDIVEVIYNYANSMNMKVSEYLSEKKSIDYTLTYLQGKNNPLMDKLKSLNLYPTWSHTKFIPQSYLYASVQDRIDLLSGLIDSDGEVNSSLYTYSTVSKQLANDVKFLVQSLGGTAKIAERQTYYTNHGEKLPGKLSYRIHIKMPVEIKAFKSEKHKSKFKKGQTTARRSIREINYVGKMEAQCISTTNPTKLYLTDEMIVTHNTSFAVDVYVMSILDEGEKLTIVANEMNIKAWQQLLLVTVLNNKFNYHGLDRKKLKTGNFSDEQWEWIRKGQKYINEVYKGRLKFVKIFDYSISDVKRIARKMAKQGFNYVLYDTFKAENSASDKMTGELIEASKQLLQVAEKENIGIIITMQLAIHTEGTRYLTAQTLSGAKAVKEVVSELVLMRNLWEDEFNGCQYDVKPFNYKLNDDGTFSKIKREVTLDPEKKYKIVFLDKTRNDEGELCVLFEFDGSVNKWTEVGYCTPVRVRQQAPSQQRG